MDIVINIGHTAQTYLLTGTAFLGFLVAKSFDLLNKLPAIIKFIKDNV